MTVNADFCRFPPKEIAVGPRGRNQPEGIL